MDTSSIVRLVLLVIVGASCGLAKTKVADSYGLAKAKVADVEIEAVTDTSAVAAGIAKLPCDIKPPLPGDKVTLVIWFKEGSVSPIYTFDVRDKSTDQAIHWSDDNSLGGRAYFMVNDKPAKLTVENVKDHDGGVYKCRVDFKKSPTRNTRVNLTVILPPERLSVFVEEGYHIPHYVLGPYNEGATVKVTCTATGGRPSPNVTWWLENALVDDLPEYESSREVKNVMEIDNLDRSHLHRVFTCQASNNNIIPPISSSVTLDLNLKPLKVALRGENRPFSAEITYNIQCDVVGARPRPAITWWKGGVQLRNTIEDVSSDGNTTTSTLTFVPKLEDSGKYLTCKASVPVLASSDLEDVWKLNIYHAPVVTLELGSNINGSAIREGVDVYFECNIKSNPWVYRVSWRHNGVTLFNNASAGTIVSNQSLVLQSVTRARAGLYTCVGSNQEGDTESSPVTLDVKFKPVCRPGQQKIHGVARQEVARVQCEVEANPPDVQFFWKFNNTSETVDIPQSHVVSEKLRSTASYTPMTELDYGSLLCWAKNDMGMQHEPCIFHVMAAGKPDGLRNCTIVNQTIDTLHVECNEGFDGGLKQEFIMEVYDTQSQLMVTNITSASPFFIVHNVESDFGFDIILYSANSKGRSDTTTLRALTLKAAEKRTAGEGVPSLLELTAVLGAAVGAVVALILFVLIIFLIIRLRGRRTINKTPENQVSSEKCLADDENNPDVIPQSNEADYIDPDEKAFELLNNAPPRIYASIPRRLQNAAHQAGCTVPEYCKPCDEVTYAELSMSLQNSGPGAGTLRRTFEPTIYAQIEVSSRLGNSLEDHAGTPLISSHHRESTMGVHRPLLETGTIPRVTATRF